MRVVPPGVARYGSFLERGVILMPGYVNIGARVGAGTMVDTWATVGSCAQIGRDCHLAGGVGIGGVLEPASAQPVIIEDGVFVGSRVVIVEGMHVGREAVIGAGVVLTSSTTILDVTGPQPVEHRGRVPARSVVIPGSRTKKFPAGEFGVPCALIIGQRSAEHRPQGQPQRGAARLRGSGLSGAGDRVLDADLRRRLDQTLLELCSIASPIGEERSLCDVVQARLSQLPWPPPIRRYGDSIVVPRHARPRPARRPRRASRHRAHRERPGARSRATAASARARAT